jgi:TrmH family RNA methyltransferase
VKVPVPGQPPGWEPSPALRGACVVLVRTQGPINLGMVARLCGNLGIDDLRLVAPQCEINCEDSRKFSTHSKELLLAAPVFPDLKAAIADCGLVVGTSARYREAELGPFHSPSGIPAVVTQRQAARWALVFGNEADGLSTEELRCCQTWVHLETFGPNSSYNLANAVAITMYLIATATPAAPAGEPDQQAADRAMVESLHDYWLETLDRIQYFRRANIQQFRPLLNRMLARWHVTHKDVQALRGMLAQINYYCFGRRFDRFDQDQD